MIGIDANVLVALAAQSHPNHSQAVTVFERELAACTPEELLENENDESD
jgi:predicted nucleic acid-binding protein